MLWGGGRKVAHNVALALWYCSDMNNSVKETREMLAVSMAELGALLGVSATSVSSLERNERAGTAKVGTIEKALAVMGYERLPNVVPTLDPEQMTQLKRHLAHPNGAGGTNAVPESTGTAEDALAAKIAAERINPRWTLHPGATSSRGGSRA